MSQYIWWSHTLCLWALSYTRTIWDEVRK